MTDLEKTIAGVHQRIESLRQDFDGSLAALAAELDAVLASAEEMVSSGESQNKRVRQLEERAEGQSELIETLTQEAQEARTLRRELRDRELEIEKMGSELETKKELIQALRQQLGEVDQLKAAARQHDKKIFEQQHELDRKQTELERANRRISDLKAELESAEERSADATAADGAELDALKAELDARKTMLKSLRADAERATSLEAQLEAKREALGGLEESIDRHVATIAELRKSADAWKKKYQAAKGQLVEDQDQTIAEPPAFTDTEVEALKELESGNRAGAPDRTVAIDMRDALKEARRQKSTAKT